MNLNKLTFKNADTGKHVRIDFSQIHNPRLMTKTKLYITEKWNQEEISSTEYLYALIIAIRKYDHYLETADRTNENDILHYDNAAYSTYLRGLVSKRTNKPFEEIYINFLTYVPNLILNY